MEEKAKGRMKEAAGAVTGDENKKAEGRAQQRKGAADEEAAQKAKRRQTEKEAREAERERDRQRRKDEGGLLGNLKTPSQHPRETSPTLRLCWRNRAGVGLTWDVRRD
jgi:uncharacterized protein YjbJ (UPF0337 family)